MTEPLHPVRPGEPSKVQDFDWTMLFDRQRMGRWIGIIESLANAQGIKFGDKNAAVAGGTGAAGIGHFRGEWLSGSGGITKRDDMWAVATGANAGAYIALKDGPAGDPWAGGADWYKLPGVAGLGQWM